MQTPPLPCRRRRELPLLENQARLALLTVIFVPFYQKHGLDATKGDVPSRLMPGARRFLQDFRRKRLTLSKPFRLNAPAIARHVRSAYNRPV
jgi:hypothetical protein